MTRKSVLLVEDSMETVRLVESILSKHYTIKSAMSGAMAMELASSGFRPDLILMDIGLPDIDGYDLCRRIRSNPSLRHAPVIFLTANTDKESEEKAFQAGGVDYLSKPFSPLVLHARVSMRIGDTRVFDLSEVGQPANKVKSDIIGKLKEFGAAAVSGQTIKERESRLHVINLDPIKSAFSARWEQIAQKVVFIADTMISASITPGESYRYFGENIFAVIYPTLTPEEGRVRVRALAEKLCRKLLGDDFGRGEYGETIVEQILYLKTDEDEDRKREQEERSRREAINRQVVGSISIEYLPIWNHESQLIEGYRTSFRREYVGRTLFGKNVLHGGSTDPLWSELYGLMIRDIIKKSQDIQGRSPYFVMTVHLASLLNKDFISNLDGLLQHKVLRDYLKIEIIGVDDDVSMAKIKAIVMLLGNFCGELMVRLSPDSQLVPELKLLGVTRFGLNFADILGSGLGRRGSYTVASHFSKRAKAHGFHYYAWDINTLSDFQIMTSAGFSPISGRVLGVPSAAPKAVHGHSFATIMKSSI